MKQLFIALFSIAALTASAQKWQNIKGNGNVKIESRQVGKFTGLEDQGSFDVEITYGESNAVEVEADENLLPIIVTKVEGTKLIVTTDKGGFSSATRLKVHVTMATIDLVSVKGSGSVSGDGGFSNSGTAHFEVGGSGSIRLSFAQFNTAEVSVRGSGSIHLMKGKVDNLNVSSSGSGSVDAYDINSKNVMAKTNGSGNVKVRVTSSLTAESNGSGNVYYKGDITNVNVKSNGSGRVVKQS